MTNVTLEQAKRIIATALEKGHTAELKPLTVAVLDTGGHLVALQREDGSGILRVEIASAKAYGALGLGISSRAIGERNAERLAFLAALGTASDGRLVPVAGGVLIRNGDGAVIGAVGVSGDTSDEDEICALAGIEATGLTTDAGA